MAHFTANITGVTLFDYLQLIQLNGKSELISVRSNQNQTGSIYLQDGRIVHVINTLNQTGKEAFFEIMTWEGFHFETAPFDEGPDQNIVDTGNLLLEAAEHLDLQNQEKKKKIHSILCSEIEQGCPIFNFLQERSKIETISIYCKGPKKNQCHRVIMSREGQNVPKDLFPDGTYLWDHL